MLQHLLRPQSTLIILLSSIQARSITIARKVAWCINDISLCLSGYFNAEPSSQLNKRNTASFPSLAVWQSGSLPQVRSIAQCEGNWEEYSTEFMSLEVGVMLRQCSCGWHYKTKSRLVPLRGSVIRDPALSLFVPKVGRTRACSPAASTAPLGQIVPVRQRTHAILVQYPIVAVLLFRVRVVQRASVN